MPYGVPKEPLSGEVLSKAAFTAHLEVLTMSLCGLASKELAALLEGTWPVLWRLEIRKNNLVDEDAIILMTDGVDKRIRALTELSIEDNQFTEAGNLRYCQVA